MDKKSYPHQKLFIAAIAASIFLHLFFSFGVWVHGYFASLRLPPTVVSQNEIELISPEELDRLLRQQQSGGQIVDQSEKALNDEVPEDTRYLSRHNQRVVRETKAAHTGAFKNSSGSHGQQDSGQRPTPTEAEKPAPEKQVQNSSKKSPIPSIGIDQLKPDFLITRTGVRESPAPVPQGAARGDGPSQSDDYLKDIETGTETLLNTREFIYFSYYNRIKDRLRQYWEPAIKEKVVTLLRQGRMVASVRTRETRLLITLDENGQLVKVQILGQSGIQDLDEAAVEAFKAAAPFPNPPKGIIEKDGTIKIRWDFILEA